MAAFLHCYGHTQAQILHIVIKRHVLIEMIGKRMPCNINCNVMSHKMANVCIPAEQLHVLQVTRPSPTGVRGWLCETNTSLVHNYKDTVGYSCSSGGTSPITVRKSLVI